MLKHLKFVMMAGGGVLTTTATALAVGPSCSLNAYRGLYGIIGYLICLMVDSPGVYIPIL